MFLSYARPSTTIIIRGGVEDIRLARPRTALSRQKQECSRPRTQAQVFSKKEKRSSKKSFERSKKGYKKIFRQTSKKGVQKIYSGDLQNFYNSKIVLSSSRGQGNFWRLEASRPRFPKCVLEDSTSDDNSQRRDTTGKFINRPSNKYFWKFCRNGRWFTSLRWFRPTLIKKIKRLRTGVYELGGDTYAVTTYSIARETCYSLLYRYMLSKWFTMRFRLHVFFRRV